MFFLRLNAIFASNLTKKMLNRRILRIKAFKVIYSRTEDATMTLKEAESQLELSCEATRDLYLFMLAIAGPLTEEAKNRIEAARGKFNPTEEELHPNMKFTRNRIAPLLEEDPDFNKIVQKKKLSWDNEDVFLRHLYETLRTRDYYKAYMESGEDSLAEDAALFRTIYENEFEDNPDLETILEGLSIWWNDDLAYALNRCCRTIEELGKGMRWSLPPLYMSEMSDKAESDKAFVVKLLRAAFAHYEEMVESIAAITPKWDRSRICSTDLALIVAGLAEKAAFPDLPSGIIINEYVEISKYYSTPESRAFVNGILDKLLNSN